MKTSVFAAFYVDRRITILLVEKQEMPFVIAELLREQTITEEDLAEFSPGLRKRVKEICTIEARKDSLC